MDTLNVRAPLRILVVDDDAAIRDLFARMLGTVTALQIDTAPSGEQALARVELEPCDVVFLDMRMPGIDGLETLQRLKALHPELPVVMMTGFAEDDRLLAAQHAGALACMKKPFDIAAIRTMLRSVHGARGRGPIQVLAVDDEPSICALFKRLESAQDFRVTTAPDAESALALSDRFDVAFLDIALPGMDGLTLCDRIKAVAPETAVILFTGHADREAAMLAKVGQGALYTMKKPFDISRVKEILKEIEEKK